MRQGGYKDPGFLLLCFPGGWGPGWGHRSGSWGSWHLRSKGGGVVEWWGGGRMFSEEMGEYKRNTLCINGS